MVLTKTQWGRVNIRAELTPMVLKKKLGGKKASNGEIPCRPNLASGMCRSF